MKIKKSKLLKKTLNFYKINFHFFDPFHLLIDGNFLQILLEKQLDIKQKLEKLLKGAVFLHSTNCIVHELSSLGEDFRGTFLRARKLSRIHCHLTENKDPKACILEVIGAKNDGKYMVATQDEDLKAELRRIPGVPVFYFLNDSLSIEEPSLSSKKFLENSQKNKLQPKKHEVSKLLEEKAKEEREFRRRKRLEELREKRKLGVLVRKKAKAPNPLSVRKKIRKNQGGKQEKSRKLEEKAESTGKMDTKPRHRSRNRRKSHKNKGNS